MCTIQGATSAAPVFEKFHDVEITQEMMAQAAKLFSTNYGVWGEIAESRMDVKRGQHVRMSSKTLGAQCLPNGSAVRNTYIRITIDGELVGNVFATRWNYGEYKMCWVTQLCVSAMYRRKGLATNLLSALRKEDKYRGIGILTSHPAAIRALLRAFGHSLSELDLTMTRDHSREIMESCPVNYVRQARLHSSAFEKKDDVESKVVCCADTGFFVDHSEPLEALARIEEQGLTWPLGDLPEGHEFLMLLGD